MTAGSRRTAPLVFAFILDRSYPACVGRKAKTKKATAGNQAEADARALHDAGLCSRGEVGKRDKDGNLPPGTTHESVDGKLVRVRYSIV